MRPLPYVIFFVIAAVVGFVVFLREQYREGKRHKQTLRRPEEIQSALQRDPDQVDAAIAQLPEGALAECVLASISRFAYEHPVDWDAAEVCNTLRSASGFHEALLRDFRDGYACGAGWARQYELMAQTDHVYDLCKRTGLLKGP